MEFLGVLRKKHYFTSEFKKNNWTIGIQISAHHEFISWFIFKRKGIVLHCIKQMKQTSLDGSTKNMNNYIKKLYIITKILRKEKEKNKMYKKKVLCFMCIPKNV